MAKNLAAVELVQKIINGTVDVVMIRKTLNQSTPELRSEAIRLFRTSGKLRFLFPEFADLFDKETF
jgi:hypothetical protein